jgi:hypothetical protein
VDRITATAIHKDRRITADGEDEERSVRQAYGIE